MAAADGSMADRQKRGENVRAGSLRSALRAYVIVSTRTKVSRKREEQKGKKRGNKRAAGGRAAEKEK